MELINLGVWTLLKKVPVALQYETIFYQNEPGDPCIQFGI
jgi:hypothetical protein